MSDGRTALSQNRSDCTGPAPFAPKSDDFAAQVASEPVWDNRFCPVQWLQF